MITVVKKLSNQFFPGLSPSEIESSKKKYGLNTITKRKRKSFFSWYISSFNDPIIKILIAALLVNVVFLFKSSSWFESLGIALAVIITTFVATVSEYGSESAFEKLQEESSEIFCRVKRSNKLILLPAKSLVVGDLVLLQSGEKIPADGHMVYGELLIDQSALNGETKEVKKYSDASENIKNSLSSHSLLFMGSSINGGDGAMIIDSVGDNTFYGKLAKEVQQDKAESPLRARLQKLAKKTSFFGYITAIIIALAYIFNNFVIDSSFNLAIMKTRLSDVRFVFQTIINSVMLAISVLVMSVPEGLPMMITIVLSSNMKKMLKKNVLVRKLVGIETAGSLNILFTDKTGTLTIGKLKAVNFVSGGRKDFNTMDDFKLSKHLFQHALENCIYNTDSQILEETKSTKKKVIGGNSTDRALLEWAITNKIELTKFDLVSRKPFNSTNKYSASVVSYKGKEKFLIKGAPEVVLSRCKFYLDENGNKKEIDKQYINKKISALGSLRLIAFAESETSNSAEVFSGLTFVGVIGLKDEIRKESFAAIKQIMEAGIQTVMITGDNKETAISVAKEVGLLEENLAKKSVYTSEELNLLSNDEIKKILPEIKVVARALPTDKSRLVKLSQEMGMVVGMTGDGINDAPALKNADVGFAMGTGTEVAKEASDIVILDNNIASTVNAILYGRTIFKSIQKFLVFRLAMNFYAVALLIIGPLIGVDMPLTVVQMLWVNMIIDALAGLAFAGEPPFEEYLKEPPKERKEEIINGAMYRQILFTGIYITAICLLFLKLPFIQKLFRFNDGSNYFMTAFFTLFIFTGVFNSFNVRTKRINIFAGMLSNKTFSITMTLVCIVQIILIYFGGSIFRTCSLTFPHLILIILLSASIIPADIIRKLCKKKCGKKQKFNTT